MEDASFLGKLLDGRFSNIKDVAKGEGFQVLVGLESWDLERLSLSFFGKPGKDLFEFLSGDGKLFW